MRETSVEKRLIRETRALGGICWKIMPVVAGMPDRLVMLPGNWIELVETKAPGGNLRPAQRVMISRVRPLGVRVSVLGSVDDVATWAAERAVRINPLDEIERLATVQAEALESTFGQAILDVIAEAKRDQ